MTPRITAVVASLMLSFAATAPAQTTAKASSQSADELRYVVYLSRHGVRSPTGKSAQYNQYSNAPWPEWKVQPGYLTPHGYHLMQLFGAYHRLQLADEGLLSPQGCADAQKITIYADSDQRTQETGKALAEGIMPGCTLSMQSRPEGTNDPLFHALGDASLPRDPQRATAAVAGRIGGDPGNLTQAYRTQLQALDHILSTCGTRNPAAPQRVSLFDIPAALAVGSGDHLIDLKGPINTASTLVENLLLEYVDGMDKTQVGWGCVGHDELQSLLTLHTAATDFTQRTTEIAKAQAGNLLSHIARSIQQAVSGKPVPGAIGKPTDLALFLVGHDTNQENISGLLNLTWIVDGRRDDTPPGGAIVFEVWRNRTTNASSVRAYYTAQTLDQMRDAVPLSAAAPPARIPLFIPACSRTDMSCDLQAFIKLLQTD